MAYPIPNELKNASTRRGVLKLSAPAKVNLALAVGPPRPSDGYHPICSWMCPISLADDLTLTRLEDDRLSRYAIVWHQDAPRPSPIDWSITRDLGVCAHQLLEKEAARPLPLQMKLEKRVPVGGGLGGGSSDAAAVLLGVRALFELDIPDARLLELAMSLGSDVAFFLSPRPSIVEGLGERLTPAPHVSAHALLIIPEFGCPTGAVYKAFDADPPAALDDRRVHALASAARIDTHALFNDLASPAERVAPALAPLRARAADAIAHPVHVTGSGSTLFAVFESAADAEDARDEAIASVPGVACVVTTLGAPA